MLWGKQNTPYRVRHSFFSSFPSFYISYCSWVSSTSRPWLLYALEVTWLSEGLLARSDIMYKHYNTQGDGVQLILKVIYIYREKLIK